MKKILFFVLLLIPLCVMAQDDGGDKKMTKFEEFSSKTGSIIKFVDYSLPKLPLNFGNLETGIRVIEGNTNAYFYRMEKASTNSSAARIAMIEYSDLVEINKALEKLQADVKTDITRDCDYLENKFKTVDGFEVGYYVSKGAANWFLKLERYSSSTVFVKDSNAIVNAFKEAQNKIEEKKNGN
ncbi:MAG: hypothetical protein IKP73_09175 [Bacteroidales bacterium]|nr:hypothetical protein [Bacteroidales bacterium]